MLYRSARAMSSASQSSKKGALIFLHGLGDTPAGWSDLKRSLPSYHSRLSDIEYVFPAAPTIPITINGGATMPGWFDLFDWPIAVGSKDDKEGLASAVRVVEDRVDKLEKDHGIPRSKIVVGGFSQGGAIALLTAYRNQREAYAGCAGLSAWLTIPEELDVADPAKETPLYWGHGTFDDKVLFQQQQFGVDKLREAGVSSVKDRSYPISHSSHPDEMKDFADFLDGCLFGTAEDEL